jgi:hypothetical protein
VQDVLFVVIVIAFFVLSAAYARGCPQVRPGPFTTAF